MIPKKVLFVSGSIGLGHVFRDLAVAKEMYEQYPEMEISWLAAQPASFVIKQAGEDLISESDQYSNDNIFAENAAQGSRLNLLTYLLNARSGWANNVEIF